MRTLAESLGVSPATVSRALNNASVISTPVRIRIVEAARKIGIIAKKQKTVAVLIPPSHLPIGKQMSEMMSELVRQAHQREYLIEFIPANHLRLLNERIISGVISLDFLSDFGRRFGHFWSLPLICVNEFANRLTGAAAVCSNEKKIMEQIVDHLVGLAHSRIGLLFMGSPEVYITSLRIEAFRSRLSAHGRMSFFEQANYTGENGVYVSGLERPLRKLMACNITALICCGEVCFQLLYPILRQEKIAFPENLEIVAWEFPEHLDYLENRIGIVYQNYSKLAEQAFDLLEKKINGADLVGNVQIDYLFAPRSI